MRPRPNVLADAEDATAPDAPMLAHMHLAIGVHGMLHRWT